MMSQNFAQLDHHLAGLVDPTLGQVVLEAADAVEVRVEAAAGGALDQVEHVLTVAEREEDRGDRAHLHAEVAEEQRHVGDARQLEQDRADHLRPRWRLDLHQLLGGEDERHLVGEAAEPVDAVDQRGHLRERADLGELLVAAVHVARRRLGPDDLLAVEAADDAQRAVRGRVLRADVEGHALGLELDVEACVGGLAGDVAQLLTIRERGHDASSLAGTAAASSAGGLVLRRHRFDVDDAGPRLDHAGEQREVLAQRVALEVGGQVHVAQIGMAVEADAEHLVALALVPVGAREDRGPGVDGERLVGDVGLDGDADVAVEVDETGEHLEAGVAAGDALADLGVGLLRLGGRVLFALAVRRRQPVEPGDETEEREPGSLQRFGGLAPRVGLGRGSRGRRSA